MMIFEQDIIYGYKPRGRWTRYDEFGYDEEGYDRDGYDKDGYNPNGDDRDSHPRPDDSNEEETDYELEMKHYEELLRCMKRTETRANKLIQSSYMRLSIFLDPFNL